MRYAVRALCLLLVLPAAAEAPDFAQPLRPGAHRVGFEEWETGELAIAAWYPARAAAPTLRFADYLGAQREGFEKFLAGAGLPPQAIDDYLDARMRAVRGAPRIAGRFPLLVVAQGNQHSAADQAVLCEFLASHGFVVVTTPSPMLATPMRGVEEIGTFAELQAGQLARAADAAQKRFGTSRNGIGVVGHSFGARAALLLAMSDASVKAVVSLDGGIGSGTGVESMRAAPSFRTGHVPPLLHLYEREDAFMVPDLALLQSVGAESLHTEKITGLHHVHFSSTGFAAAAIPVVARLTGAPSEVSARMAYIAERTRAFLARHLGR